uniref:Aminotransferase-like protein n=1 Tax=Oryza sativa subsp. japonica TaxID=39947 RepID=Q69Q67_ORYSJ|nr:aminotransferase-like protein [Oryza sativa Japonica Group]BAD31383.1 aminotransferase-like protein [Oryza sativa Japonica Group]
MARDEPMMAATSYFWSRAMNTFLFSQGPMTPTLLDSIMITGLDVTSSANLSSLDTQLTHEFKTRSIGGWTSYVAKNMGTGPVSPREHAAFLMMWLEKFLFCGPSCGPTANWQRVAENLVEKKHFPLGKYLLGYLYQTLNTAINKIASGELFGTGGPWWLLRIWLNLHTRMVVNRPPLVDARSPRFEPIIDDDGETSTTRRCMSFGEAASVSITSRLSAKPFGEWFNNFYDGFPKNSRIWFAYEGHGIFELLGDFRFDEINSKKYDKSREVFSAAISPCIIPVGIHQGKNIQMTYEFYHPTSAARQFGMGQLPISLFFADKIQSRGEITSLLMMDRLLNLPRPPLGSINNINFRMLRAVPQLSATMPPKTSTLLHGLPRVPIAPAAGKKRAKSAAAPSAAKKKARKQKTAADDLPAIDPDVAEFLEDEAMAEEKKKVASKKPQGTSPPPPRPPTLVSESSENTPSAVGSHHVEEEEVASPAPACYPSDMFSFDIRPFLDEEEETTSQALVPLADDTKSTLLDISKRHEGSLETLVTSCGSILDRLNEIHDKIPDELANAITPTAYLEQHRLKLEKAQKRIADRRERRDLEATIQANRASINEEKAKLDELEAGPSATQANIDRLNNRKIELLAEPEQRNAQLALEQEKLADLPKAIEDQKSKLKASVKHLTELTKSLKPISSTDAADAKTIDEVDQIRQRAISAIQRYVSG